MTVRKLVSLFLTITLTISLAACGGSDSKSNSTPVEPTATITNSDQAAAAISAPESEQFASSSLSGSASGAVPFAFGLSEGISRGLFQPRTTDGSPGMQLVPESFCATGSISTPPAGSNSGTVTFNNCEIGGFGLFYNGSISFNVIANSNSFIVTFTYDNFTVSDSTKVLVSIDGGISMEFSFANDVWTTTVATVEITITIDGESVTIADYSISTIVDFNSGDAIIDYHYAVTSDAIGGTVIVTTRASEGGSSIRISSSQPYPYAGMIIIIGADNDRIRVSINGGMPNDTVVVEYALDGDGIYDDGIDVYTWPEFEAKKAYALDPLS